MLNNESEQGSNAGGEVIHNSASSSNLINNLNNDCLAKVFKNLPWEQRLEVETVCKRWKEASKFAWDDITALNFNAFSYGPNDIGKLPLSLRNTNDIGRILKRCGGHLKELHIGRPYQPIILSIIAQYCSNLRKLMLNFIHYDIDWNPFLPLMVRLESLKIEDFTEWFFRGFFENLPETLTELEISRSQGRGNIFPVTTAFSNIKHLRYLKLTHFSLESGVMDALSKKPDLTHLDLRVCHIGEDFNVLLRMKNLEYLYLKNIFSYPGVNDTFVIHLANTCKHLKYLHLSGYNEVTDSGIVSLQGLAQLEELNLSCLRRITDGPLGGMFQLKILNCINCNHVGDTGIIRLIKNAAELEQLTLKSCNVTVAIIEDALDVTRVRNSLPLKICIDEDIVKQRDIHADKIYSPLLTLTASC